MSTSLGLEIWLIGTPAEVEAAARMLARLGVVAYHSGSVPMTGADAGRVRAYARVHVSTRRAVADTPTARTPPTASTAPNGGATLLDLAA